MRLLVGLVELAQTDVLFFSNFVVHGIVDGGVGRAQTDVLFSPILSFWGGEMWRGECV